MEVAQKNRLMRHIKLSGREATVVRAIGFTEPMMGAEIHEYTNKEVEDVTDTLNGRIRGERAVLRRSADCGNAGHGV
jgi:hypothetical protein